MKKFVSLTLALLLISVVGFTACASTPDQTEMAGIKYYADGSLIVRAMLSDEETIGLVPEPAASNLIKKAKAQNKTLYRLDLQELYDSEKKEYPQAVMMVKESVLATYGDTVNNMLSKIEENVSWAKNNPEGAVNAIKGKFDATTLSAATLSEAAVNGCKIYHQNAYGEKERIIEYLSGIIAVDEAGAKAVNDEFFYNGTANGICEKSTLKVAVPDGAPALAIAKFINDGENFGTELSFEYSVVKASVLPASYRNGDYDIVILPVNAASKFYDTDGNSQDPYKIVSVITHGNFYIISTEEMSVTDLRGKRIAVPNKGAVPDWTFRMTMKKHGIEVYDTED